MFCEINNTYCLRNSCNKPESSLKHNTQRKGNSPDLFNPECRNGKIIWLCKATLTRNHAMNWAVARWDGTKRWREEWRMNHRQGQHFQCANLPRQIHQSFPYHTKRSVICEKGLSTETHGSGNTKTSYNSTRILTVFFPDFIVRLLSFRFSRFVLHFSLLSLSLQFSLFFLVSE